MTLTQLAGLGRKLAAFLQLFNDCFGRGEGRGLLRVYVQGQLSDLKRKTAEGIALRFRTAPRTLQRFLESIKWNEEKLRDRCQQIVAKDHAHPEAIGIVDESGVAKSGKAKVDNCVVGVHLGYSAPGFQCLLDSVLYLPEDWANDPERRKKTTYPTKSSSARNRSWLWRVSIGLWPTEFAWRHGRSTNCTAATASFWMA
jgi:SRSO17 transposase